MIRTRDGNPMMMKSDAGFAINVPIQIKRRGGRKAVARVDVENANARPWDDSMTPLQHALVQGGRWLAMLESGLFPTLTELAEHEKMDRAYVSRRVSLTLLAPDIIEAILDETLPSDVTLFDLASRMPLSWEKQRALVNQRK